MPSVAAAAPATPVRPFHSPGSSGTPSAKRPARLVPDQGMTGPVMNADELNTFVYQLHFKIESMGVWAANFHETMTDHAAHIDDVRQRTAASFGLVKAETDSIRAAAATAELDTRTVMQKVQENDDQLKASVTKVTDMIGKEIASLKQDGQKITSDTAVEAARVASKLLELQTAVGDLRTAISSSGPTGATVVQQPPGPDVQAGD